MASLTTEYGELTAAEGHAAVLNRHARTGRKALRILGGQNHQIRLVLPAALQEVAQLSFWLQRWTSKGPFDFRLIAETPTGDVEVQRAPKVPTGGYDETVGLFYEPSLVSETNDYHGIGFLRIPLDTIVSGQTEK